MTPSTPGSPLLEMVIISGMSGAGRSTAARALEDLGWFVVDNLPPALLPTLADLAERAGSQAPRIACVIDVRGRTFFDQLEAALQELSARGVKPRTVFLEASDEALVRRFESVRRPHPLQAEGRVPDGIRRERELLRTLRGDADIVVDTSNLNVHELRDKVEEAFSDTAEIGLRATVVSFGYKYGLPADADLVVDCRFIPNPHWVAELRGLTGRDAPVRDYVFGQDGVAQFVDGYVRLLETVARGYRREGKRFFTLAVGCTGGKHRSVAIAEALGTRLAEAGVDSRVVHRDLGRE